MAREMSALPPLRAYTINILGSLAGVVAFARHVVAGAAADLLVRRGVRRGRAADRRRLRPVRRAAASAARRTVGLLGIALVMVHTLSGSAIWSPVLQDHRPAQRPAETVVEVNNIFHQSMAPVDQKEYFYQWPYMAFGDTLQERADPRRRIGHRRGGGAAPRRRARGRGRDRPGDHPPRHGATTPTIRTTIPRVTVVNDDARHFLRTTTKKYDLVVFALIDSLTLQSSFSGVRLESYMFTEESFREVRDHLSRRRRAGDLQLLPRALAGRSARQHGGGGVRRGALRPRPRGARVSRRPDGGSAAAPR